MSGIFLGWLTGQVFLSTFRYFFRGKIFLKSWPPCRFTCGVPPPTGFPPPLEVSALMFDHGRLLVTANDENKIEIIHVST